MTSKAIAIETHGRPQPFATSHIWNGIQTIWAAITQHAERRRAVRDLRAMDPRMLRDIGIDRSEIMSVVYTPSRERTVSYGNF